MYKMTQVEKMLNTMDISHQFQQINHLIESAKVKISSWGTRIVTIAGIRGTITLERLAKSIQHAAKKKEIRELSKVEIAKRVEVFQKLNLLRITSDEQLKRVNCYTKIFNVIKEFFTFIFSGWTPISILRDFEEFKNPDSEAFDAFMDRLRANRSKKPQPKMSLPTTHSSSPKAIVRFDPDDWGGEKQ